MERVQKTLAGFESVTKVEFHPDREQFEVEYRQDHPLGEDFRSAVADIIIFPGMRKFLGGVGNRLHNSQTEES